MKRYLSRLILFSVPVLLYLILVVIIDPYNYFKISNAVDNSYKSSISFKVHYPMWKLLRYNDAPCENILLGDSRVNLLDEDKIERLTGKKFSSLAYGGGTLQEVIDTFWYISRDHELKNVYIGISFNLYNGLNTLDRVNEAERINSNVASHAFSSYVAKASFQIMKSLISGETVNLEKPIGSKEEFWKEQLAAAANFYQNYSYPEYYNKELKNIGQYCEQKNINLVFFVPPNHMDLQERVADFGLEEEQIRFKKDINSITTVIDFDIPSEFTKDSDNFLDPFHFDHDVAKLVIEDLLMNKSKISQK